MAERNGVTYCVCGHRGRPCYEPATRDGFCVYCVDAVHHHEDHKPKPRSNTAPVQGSSSEGPSAENGYGGYCMCDGTVVCGDHAGLPSAATRGEEADRVRAFLAEWGTANDLDKDVVYSFNRVLLLGSDLRALLDGGNVTPQPSASPLLPGLRYAREAVPAALGQVFDRNVCVSTEAVLDRLIAEQEGP